MTRLRTLFAGLVFVLAISTASIADDAASRALIQTVIEKNGGEKLLEKFPARSTKIKGTMTLFGQAIPISGELLTQNGNQHRMAISLTVEGQSMKYISVIDRDHGWQQLYDDTKELTADQLKDAKQAAYAGWLATLVPLKDKAFQLSAIGETEVDKRPAVGVNVTREGYRPFKMLFDKETLRLVRTETVVRDETTSKEMTQESTFSNFELVDGIPHAKKVTIKRDGLPHVDVEVVSFKPSEKLEDNLFGKP